MGVCQSKSSIKSDEPRRKSAPARKGDVKPEAHGVFIGVDQLVKLMRELPKEKLVILDTSCKPEGDIIHDHQKSHLPGARFLDLSMVRDFTKPYPFMMPEVKHFIRMMKALGVRKSQTIVLYEQGKGWFATRAAFMMQAFGHQSVYVLDGGLTKWVAEGNPTEGEDVTSWDAEFDYSLQDADKILSYDRIKEIETDGSIQLIENRPPPMVEKTGTMPGAIHLPSPSLLQEDGTVKDADSIQQLLQSKGVDLDKPMAFTCGGGIMAAFALGCAMKAGVPVQQLYLYDGSWSEYGARKAQSTA